MQYGSYVFALFVLFIIWVSMPEAEREEKIQQAAEKLKQISFTKD